jgi:hypothetical protein
MHWAFEILFASIILPVVVGWLGAADDFGTLPSDSTMRNQDYHTITGTSILGHNWN